MGKKTNLTTWLVISVFLLGMLGVGAQKAMAGTKDSNGVGSWTDGGMWVLYEECYAGNVIGDGPYTETI